MQNEGGEALLNRVGEQINMGLGDANIRNNVLNLLGEKQTKRVVKSEQFDEQAEEMAPLDPIDQDEQFIAQMQIQEMHPLSSTPWSVAFPWLCICLSCCPKAEPP